MKYVISVKERMEKIEDLDEVIEGYGLYKVIWDMDSRLQDELNEEEECQNS